MDTMLLNTYPFRVVCSIMLPCILFCHGLCSACCAAYSWAVATANSLLCRAVPCCAGPARYTPEHMAVVVVGDFPDCSNVADMIKQHLGAAFQPPAGSSSSSSSSPQQQVAAVPRPPLPVVSPDSWQHTEPR